jgi:hypothetical protein
MSAGIFATQKGVLQIPDDIPFEPHSKHYTRSKVLRAYKAQVASSEMAAKLMTAAFARFPKLKNVRVESRPFDENLLDEMVDESAYFGAIIKQRYYEETVRDVTEITAENTAIILNEWLACYQTGRMTGRVFEKGEQSGKSKDQYDTCITLPAAAKLLYDVLIRPMIILPGERDITAQARKEYAMSIAPLSMLEFIKGKKRVSLHKILRSVMRYEFCRLFVPRTNSSENFAGLQQHIRYAIAEDAIPLLIIDEVDKGIGPNSVIEAMLKLPVTDDNDTPIQMIAKGNTKIAVYGFTATPGVFSYMGGAKWETRRLKAEENYVHWTKQKIDTLRSFAQEIQYPDFDLLPDTCHSISTPLMDGPASEKTFVRSMLVKENGELRLRQAGESPTKWRPKDIKSLLAYRDNEVRDLLEAYRKDIPRIIAGSVKNMFTHLPGVNGCIMRVVVNNHRSRELCAEITEELGDKDILVFPIFDNDGKSDVRDTIERHFREAEIEPFSVPYLALITAGARRGSRVPDNIVLVTLTHEPDNWATASQANGRIGGYKENSRLVLTATHKARIEGELSGLRPMKPHHKLTRGSVGRPISRDMTIARMYRWPVELNSNKRNKFVIDLFRKIDTKIMSHDRLRQDVLKQLITNKRQNNCKSISICGGEGIPYKFRNMPSIFSEELIDLNVLNRIETEHDAIFIDGDGNPKYNRMKLLPFNPDGEQQPEGMVKNDKRESYHCRMVDGKPFFYHGFRYRPVTVNTAARKKSWLQQPQLGFDVEWSGNPNDLPTLKCTEIAFRLKERAAPSTSGYFPVEGSLPSVLDNLAAQEN